MFRFVFGLSRVSQQLVLAIAECYFEGKIREYFFLNLTLPIELGEFFTDFVSIRISCTLSSAQIIYAF